MVGGLGSQTVGLCLSCSWYLPTGGEAGLESRAG